MKWLIAGIAGCMAVAFAATLHLLGILNVWNDTARDWQLRTQMVMGGNAQKPVFRVAFQDDGVSPFPPERLDYALVMNAMAPVEPKVLGLDLPLAGDDTVFPVHDQQLLHVAQKFGKIVLSAEAGDPGSGAVPPNVPVIPSKGSIQSVSLLKVGEWPGKFAAGMTVAPQPLRPDLDGITRRLPLVVREGKLLYPTWILSVVGATLHADWEKSVAEPGEFILLRKADATEVAKIPIDSYGMIRIAPSMVGGVKALDPWDIVEKREYFLRGDIKSEPFEELRSAVVLVGLESKEFSPPVNTPDGWRSPFQVVSETVALLLSGKLVPEAPGGWVWGMLIWLGLGVPMLSCLGRWYVGMPLGALAIFLPLLWEHAFLLPWASLVVAAGAGLLAGISIRVAKYS